MLTEDMKTLIRNFSAGAVATVKRGRHALGVPEGDLRDPG